MMRAKAFGVLSGLMVLLLCLSMSHMCAGAVPEENGKTVRIVASFYPMYIMARNVARDVPDVTVENLTLPMTGCLHDYTVTTSDMKKFSDADILVANGVGMESFLDLAVSQYPQIHVIRLTEGMVLIAGDGDEGDNPHVWVGISGAIEQVKNLGASLEKADAPHAALYRVNTQAYVARLEALREKMHAALDPYKGKKIVTFHEAFPYFAREFGFDIAAVVEREPGSEPSAKELAETIDLVRGAGINALFAEPQYPSKAADMIAAETGAKVYVLDPAVSGPDDLDAYVNIMEKNLEVLKSAFAGE
jgi:zinc transport system substrate-binding protein